MSPELWLLARVALVLGLLVVGLRRGLSLGVVMPVGALLLGVLFHLGWPELPRVLARSLVAADTLEILGILILIMVLEQVMSQQGMMKKLVDGVREAVKSPRLALPLLPALIGFMPMAGGALFSCPLLHEVSRGYDLSGNVKSFVNYWFRHIWEFSLPVYPAVVLSASLAGLPLSQVIRYLGPFTLAAMGLGTLVLQALAGPELRRPTGGRFSLSGMVPVLSALGPLLAAVFLVVGLDWPVVPSLALGLAGGLVLWGFPLARLPGTLAGVKVPILLSVVGIMMFKEVLLATEIPEALPDVLLDLGLPALALAMVLPFALGLLTGLSVAFVGMGLPLLLSLTGTAPPLPLLVLFFVSGYAGVMLTPVHLCFTLTLEYFRADFFTVWRWVLAAQGAMVALALVQYVLLT